MTTCCHGHDRTPANTKYAGTRTVCRVCHRTRNAEYRLRKGVRVQAELFAWPDRFWRKVDKTDRCWNWKAGADGRGYGLATLPGWPYPKRAHIIAYEMANGPVPDGLVLDHLCRNTSCVNPEHLEAVTQRVNVLRGEGTSAKNARATHCKYGHPFSGENLRIVRGIRRCQACHKRRKSEEYQRRRARITDAADRGDA